MDYTEKIFRKTIDRFSDQCYCCKPKTAEKTEKISDTFSTGAVTASLKS